LSVLISVNSIKQDSSEVASIDYVTLTIDYTASSGTAHALSGTITATSACTGSPSAAWKISGTITGTSSLSALLRVAFGFSSSQSTTSARFAGSAASVSGIGDTAWSSLAAATGTTNNSAATCLPTTTTNYLQCTNFGFTTSTLPSGAKVLSIAVAIHRYSDHSTVGDNIIDNTIQLLSAGSLISDNLADLVTKWGVSNNVVNYTFTNDLPTDGECRDSSFGVAIAADMAGGITTAFVDSVSVTITYSIGSVVASVSACSGSLSVAWGMSGTIAATSGGSCGLSVNFGCAGTTAGDSDLTASLLRTFSISGTISDTSDFPTASLFVNYGEGGTIAAVSALTGTIHVDRGLSGTCFSGSSLSGTSSTRINLIAGFLARSELYGTLSVPTLFASGTCAAMSSLTGDMTRLSRIMGTIIGTSELIGLLQSAWGLRGTIEGVSDLFGSLSVNTRINPVSYSPSLEGRIVVQEFAAARLRVDRTIFGTLNGSLMSSYIPIGNSTDVIIDGLQNNQSKQYINSASLTYTLKDVNGNAVASGSLAYDTGSNGVFRATISSSITDTLTEGQKLTLIVSGTGGGGTIQRTRKMVARSVSA
jgi:hypothetical protein